MPTEQQIYDLVDSLIGLNIINDNIENLKNQHYQRGAYQVQLNESF